MLQALPNYQLQQPNYNAVKIDIHNPTVGACTTPQAQPAQMAQYGAPFYNYPQSQLYNYPQAPQQPYYFPQQFPTYLPPYVNPTAVNPQPVAVQQMPTEQVVTQQMPAQPVAVQPASVVPQMPAQPIAMQPVPGFVCPPCPNCNTQVQPVPVQQAPQQVNINQAPMAPAPVAVENLQPEVSVTQPQQMTPMLDLNNFLARLSSPDFEIQANAMEEIANMVKDEPVKATELLDAKIIDQLINVMNVDSSKLAGPTQEQIAARQKLMSGQQISEADKTLATTITPMEQAERNKSYAMFTTAILQKLYAEEVTKLTGNTVPLTELPGAMNIVDQLKDNPNPMVRSSAIEALSYVQAPDYKKDLTTLFTIAQKDQDKNVQESATIALEKLNQI